MQPKRSPRPTPPQPVAFDPVSVSPITRRQLLSLGGGLMAAAALGACSSDNGGSRREASAASSGDAGGNSIEQWYHQYGEAGTEEAVKRYAAAYSDASVNVSWVGGDYEAEVADALGAGNGPDVFEFANGPTLDMIQSGQVVDMTDVFGDRLSEFNTALVKRVTWEDKIWAVPQMLDMQCLLYRKSMLDAAGIEPPDTIDELAAAAELLTSGEVKGLYLGEDGGATLMSGPMLWASGQSYIANDSQVGFTAERAGAAFAKLHDLWASDVLLTGTDEDWWSAAPLIGGQCAMQFTGLWTFPTVTEALGEDFGAIPWPSLPSGAKSVPMGAYGACVSADARDVDAAKAFVKWLWVEQSDFQIDFATAYGVHVPARNPLASQAVPLESGPAADAARYAATVGRAQNHILWTPTSQAALDEAVIEIVQNGADPTATTQGAIDVASDELARVLG